MLFVEGFQSLSSEGVLDQLVAAHKNSGKIHKSAQNFFWHSYWLYELENAFRALGAQWDCFTLPYWDVTDDAEYWTETEDPQIGDIPIYNRSRTLIFLYFSV